MKIKKLLIIAPIVILAVMITAVGCKKEEPSVQHDHQHDAMNEQAAPTDTAAAETAETEQTTCPVMGGPINKDYFIEYEGKKVYFCCPGCEEQFLENPEQYLSKLPQFNDAQ